MDILNPKRLNYLRKVLNGNENQLLILTTISILNNLLTIIVTTDTNFYTNLFFIILAWSTNSIRH